MYGICNLSLVPVRKEPNDRSEMVTQLLFGETFEVIEKQKAWHKIVTSYDDYTGWIDEKQYHTLAPEEFKQNAESQVVLSLDLVQLSVTENNLFPILLGSNLPAFTGTHCTIGTAEYQYHGNSRQLGHQPTPKHQIAETAHTYMNSPYLWGGRSPFGIDCSGFTQLVYKLNGVVIKRDAWQQAEQGQLLSFIDEAEPGDLAFFENEEKRITHVGIILSEGKIIHAHGKVRIDTLDYHGIYNAEQKRYTHKLRLIKRYY